MSVLNLAEIERALREVQRVFPQINKDLFDRRDPLDDEVIENMMQGYALVDQLLTDRIDIFAMGQLNYWLKLNAVVLCGVDPDVVARHHRLLEATAARFYDEPGAGIRDVMDWYAFNRGKSVWRRAAGAFNRILSDPQLFIEGNHRSGALIMSYVLAKEGRPPFVLTRENARGFFNPSSVIKKAKKRSFIMQYKFQKFTGAFADYLQNQQNPAFLESPKAEKKRVTAGPSE
ncbi:conserved hypothetical protein [Methylocella silvestris BL2]|uniref:Fido domain-containing protein n=1 Tax=Methylocella silvestris (strain DSM 15510 / CIP 108128 / LMG 27833 / NCIMB 13906 / BL2) TaxID=395965 RepID=B8EQ81_METSB|nr:hypothetical protein [Methylocella silvestris]ACK51571.1 conserved hypothetical protein [Methylocella silvestris BL2]